MFIFNQFIFSKPIDLTKYRLALREELLALFLNS
jgi:hypothetical protein